MKLTAPTSVLVMSPSAGLGGGIERVADAVMSAFRMKGILAERLNLFLRGEEIGRVARHSRLMKAVDAFMESASGPVRLVLLHRSLLPVAWLAVKRHQHLTGVSVMLHGIDVWGGRIKPELTLLRHPKFRPVCVSSFSAGALGVSAHATVLHPTISGEWYDTLLGARALYSRADHHTREGGPLRITSVFRLGQWRDKGLGTLVRASALLGIEHEITVCGSGTIDDGLARLIESVPHLKVKSNLADRELADQLARADVVGLATRMRGGKMASGEGYGLGVIEGQLAGAATFAPAFGGGNDTFIDGLTGRNPVDEGAPALASVLREYLDPVYRGTIAAAGHTLAKQYFEPRLQAQRVVERLL